MPESHDQPAVCGMSPDQERDLAEGMLFVFPSVVSAADPVTAALVILHHPDPVEMVELIYQHRQENNQQPSANSLRWLLLAMLKPVPHQHQPA